MSALSADHHRIFARFDAKVTMQRSDDGFTSIGKGPLKLLWSDMEEVVLART